MSTANHHVKRGECPNCGTKTHKISIIGRRRIPLTKPGLVSNGTCLVCKRKEPRGPARESPRKPANQSRVAPGTRRTPPHDDSIVQSGVRCDGCSSANFRGARFECKTCQPDEYDLCQGCYDRGVHDTSHAFLRYGKSGTAPTWLPPRNRARVAPEAVQRGVVCDSCATREFKGPRFECVTCQGNYDMCRACFQSGAHELDHVFIRYDTVDGQPVPVPPRRKPVTKPGPGSAVRQVGVVCDGCGDKEFTGSRFECVSCNGDFDMCQRCFDKGVHDLAHVLIRYDTVGGQPVPVPPRQKPLSNLGSGSGARQVGVVCDGCGDKEFTGPRFECVSCNGNFDMCQRCFDKGTHDLDHVLIRYDTADAQPVPVPPRRKPAVDIQPNETARQVGVVCDGCGEKEFTGARFECKTCIDGGTEYDCCRRCYENDTHGKEGHVFVRYDTVDGQPVLVPPRPKPTTEPEEVARQVGVACDGCEKKDFLGPRYECKTCSDSGKEYDCCQSCYDNNTHDMEGHIFLRFDTVDGQPVPVLPRSKVPEKTAEAPAAQAGVVCDGCGVKDFPGARYECKTCMDSGSEYDCCQRCFENNAHGKEDHEFVRFDTVDGQPVPVPSRRKGAEETAEEIAIQVGVVCDGCGMKDFAGARYECKTCMENGSEYDCCDSCFENNAHGKEDHEFVRFDTVDGQPVPVPPRDKAAEETAGGSTEEPAIQAGVVCDGCGTKDFAGARYECKTCMESGSEYDCCQSCFENNAHGQEDHEFIRFDTVDGQPVPVPPQNKAPKETAGEATEEPVVQIGVVCDGCGVKEFIGARYECQTCIENGTEYDSCSKCYDAGVHDKTHSFKKFDGVMENPEYLPPGVEVTEHCEHCEGTADEKCACTEGCEFKEKSKCLIIQTGFSCAGCGSVDFVGCRYQCKTCEDTNLCASCYKEHRHDMSHDFLKFDQQGVEATEVTGNNDPASCDSEIAVLCDYCGECEIGRRFECSTCKGEGLDYDLCEECYQSNYHDLTHSFRRIDRTGSNPVQLPPRSE